MKDWTDVPLADPTGRPNTPRSSQNAPLVSAQHADLYASWAELSNFRGYTNNRFFRQQRVASGSSNSQAIAADDWVSFIAKAKNEKVIADVARKKGSPATGFAYIPFTYRNAVPGSEEKIALHFTGRVHRNHLHKLSQHPGIERWELALPVAVPDSGKPNDTKSIPASLANRPKHKARDVIAVIDYGCALLNTCFRTADRQSTRIHHFWDQGGVRDSNDWLKSSGFGYGRVLDQTGINQWLDKRRNDNTLGRGTDEGDTYRQMGLLHWRGRFNQHIRKTAHGTHVLDVVGGRINPWTQREDLASNASLVFIELPFYTAADGSGGSLSLHLLDGVREILRVSAANAKVMISISQGTHAGPHDGSTLIEQALDELLELRPKNFCIVIGAGNAKNSQGHVNATLAAGETVELALDVPALDRTDTFVECWYPRVLDGQDTEVVVTAIAPQVARAGPAAAAVAPAGAAKALFEAAPKPAVAPTAIAALIHRSSSANGHDALALLALGPTDKSYLPARDHVASGTWRLRLHNAGKLPVPVDCYVERDEPVRPPRQAYPKFLPQSLSHNGVRLLSPTGTGTLNTLATGQHTVVVGACFWDTGRPSPYSSLGPIRGAPSAGVATPHVLAAADNSTQLPGVRAAAVRSGSTFRMNGTSVAAPTLARQLFIAMMGRDILRADWAGILSKMPPVRPQR